MCALRIGRGSNPPFLTCPVGLRHAGRAQPAADLPQHRRERRISVPGGRTGDLGRIERRKATTFSFHPVPLEVPIRAVLAPAGYAAISKRVIRVTAVALQFRIHYRS